MIVGFSHRRADALYALALLVALALGVVGCGNDDDDNENGGSGTRPATYVGMLEGSRIAIALVTDGKTVAGYLCADRGLSVWLVESEISDEQATLTNRRGEKVGSVSLSEARASGEVTVEGVPLAFTATPATDDAGLFRGLPADGAASQELGVVALPAARGSKGSSLGESVGTVVLVGRITWIIRNDGGQTGTVLQFRDPLPEAAAAKPFSADVTYPAIAEVIGADDMEHGAEEDPQGERDVELLAGIRWRITELGPETLN